MGSASSVQTDARAEAAKDAEATDITTLEEGVEEVKRLRALLTLHEKRYALLDTLFAKLDKDSSGFLEVRELNAVVEQFNGGSTDDFLSAYDNNKSDGKIDRSEFLAFFADEIVKVVNKSQSDDASFEGVVSQLALKIGESDDKETAAAAAEQSAAALEAAEAPAAAAAADAEQAPAPAEQEEAAAAAEQAPAEPAEEVPAADAEQEPAQAAEGPTEAEAPAKGD